MFYLTKVSCDLTCRLSVSSSAHTSMLMFPWELMSKHTKWCVVTASPELCVTCVLVGLWASFSYTSKRPIDISYKMWRVDTVNGTYIWKHKDIIWRKCVLLSTSMGCEETMNSSRELILENLWGMTAIPLLFKWDRFLHAWISLISFLVFFIFPIISTFYTCYNCVSHSNKSKRNQTPGSLSLRRPRSRCVGWPVARGGRTQQPQICLARSSFPRP